MTIYVSKDNGDEYALRLVFADFVNRTFRRPNRDEILLYGRKLTAEQICQLEARREMKAARRRERRRL